MRLAKAQLWAQLVILLIFLALCWPAMTVWRESLTWINFLSVFAIIEGAAGGVAAAWAAVEAAKDSPTCQRCRAEVSQQSPG